MRRQVGAAEPSSASSASASSRSTCPPSPATSSPSLSSSPESTGSTRNRARLASRTGTPTLNRAEEQQGEPRQYTLSANVPSELGDAANDGGGALHVRRHYSDRNAVMDYVCTARCKTMLTAARATTIGDEHLKKRRGAVRHLRSRASRRRAKGNRFREFEEQQLAPPNPRSAGRANRPASAPAADNRHKLRRNTETITCYITRYSHQRRKRYQQTSVLRSRREGRDLRARG